MGDRIATPKQTAGQGFAFEDKVVAYYFVWMLAGTSPLKGPTPISRIDCQVAADGWDGFDDLLITSANQDEIQRHAFSLKSNVQFTRASAPASFVKHAWSLLLHRSSHVMDVENDRFGLICAPHPDPPRTAIQSLLAKARCQKPAQLSARIAVPGYASSFERSIHGSCSCPAELAQGLDEQAKLPGNILARMSVIEFDFENLESSAEATSLFVCSQLARGGSGEEATNLWNVLCLAAQQVRGAGGGISRSDLLSRVRSVVELRDLPDFADDWRHIDAWSAAQLSAIPDSIGGIARIYRDDVAAGIIASLQLSHFVAAVGASGTGKTVVAKRVAEESKETGNVLWLKGEQMRTGYVEVIGTYRHLAHSLNEVLANGKHECGLIVLDGAERLLDDADFAELCLLLQLLEMDKEGSIWRLLITCREEAWDRVQLGMARAFGRAIPFEHARVEYPDFQALAPVWEAFPALRTLALHPHLSHFMRNLKVLDLLAFAIVTGRKIDTDSWIGESELIKWYWQQVVRRSKDGVHRDVLLRKLASDFADAGRFEMKEGDLCAHELSLLEGLSDMLHTDGERGIVIFVHDLIADWARLQVLISHEQELGRFCEHRFMNPHWHAALRLYGVSLLEMDGSGDKWKSAITNHAGLQDCLLESLVFAANSPGLIDNVWQVLVADEGSLLKAFLKRFQYIASIPNPQYVMLATGMGVSAEQARTWERVPVRVYWHGVLNALTQHVADLVTLAPIDTARLARTWLRYTPHDLSGRQEAASLALAVAQETIRTEKYYHGPEDDGQLPYKALFESYPDRPDTVRDLLLKAAARKVPAEEDGVAFEDYQPPGTITHVDSVIMGGDRIALEPWPDGPLYRVCSEFRAACFTGDTLRVVMSREPDLAREIILALLIERRPPKMEPDYLRESTLLIREVGLENDGSFHPRFYTRGPFLLFLRINPEAALNTIIRLVDFATERWIERHHQKEDKESGIDLPLDSGLKRFVGDGDVYHWYHGISCSDIVSSALMAIEKWFYDCLEKNETIDSWLDLILGTAQSAAFLGMLSEIGRFSPGLFTGRLRPLILVPETYYMEVVYMMQGGHNFGTPFSFQEGEWFFNLARKWDSMEHRRWKLIDIAACLFHNHTETREALSEARQRWNEISDESDEQRYRHKEALIATFDADNWKEVQQDDGPSVLMFEQPDHLKTPPEELARNEKRMLLLTLPVTCRNMLDERKPLEAEQIPLFLARSKDLVGFGPGDKEIARTAPTSNAILGTIAVLFVLHREWLRANPKEEEWCLEMLDKILSDPPQWSEFDLPESVGNYDWEHFACEIVPVIWAEAPTNGRYKERIAFLVFAKHYGSVSILFARAFERRNALGDDFWRLTNLLLDWAAVRYDVRDQHHTAEKIDFEKWARRAMKKFIKGTYQTDIPRWGQQSIENGKLWSAHNSYPRYLGRNEVHLLTRIPRLDLRQVQATFRSVFLPSQAASDSERKCFLEFWDQALITCLAGTRFFDKEGNKIEEELVEAGLPYDYERWVIECLTVVIAQMRQEERPERYWKPILRLGARAEHWVEHFLNHWFMDAKKTMSKVAFIREWKGMLEFCLCLQSWFVDNGRSAIHLPTLWLCLIGLPRFATSLWQDEDASIVTENGIYFAQVAAHILTSAHDSVQLLSWLCQTSAKGIRCLMIKPIADVALAASDHWWKEEHVAKVMAQFVGSLIRDHEIPEVERKLLLAIMHKAASTQEPLAMELQAQMASSK